MATTMQRVGGGDSGSSWSLAYPDHLGWDDAEEMAGGGVFSLRSTAHKVAISPIHDGEVRLALAKTQQSKILMEPLRYLQKLRTAINNIDNIAIQSIRSERQLLIASERQLLMLGRLLSETVKSRKRIASLSEVEFKVFSQWGDDGIIQWLVNNLEFPNKTFVEFGVENYRESITRFLMMNDNWSGLVMDEAESNVAQIINSEYFWKYTLSAKAVFIDADNINKLLSSSGLDKQVGILHVDLDGNDYWIWKEINVISPILVILEYNSVFGIDRAITIPYDKTFFRTNAHYSNLYFGASLRALHQLSADKGYAFVGSNSAGNNAYFVRNDKLNDSVQAVSLEGGYVLSMFRESRDKDGRLTYLTGRDRIEVINGMPVYNIDTNQIEKL